MACKAAFHTNTGRDPLDRMATTLPIPLTAVAVAIVMNVLWGGNPVAVKLGLEAFPPFWTAFLRFSIGIGCVAAWMAATGVSLWPSREEWKPYLGLSLLFGVQIWLMNVGYGRTSGSMGAVLMSVYPLVSALLGHWFIFGDRLDSIRTCGLVIAFIGTGTVLLGETATGELEIISIGNWIVILSGTLLGIRLTVSTRVVRASDPARTTLWQMVLSQPWFLAGAIMTETIAWEGFGWRPVAGIAFQGIVIAGAGFMIIAYFLRRYRASTMISFGFVTPVSGVALSMWILGEDMPASFVVGLVEVAVGLALVLREPPERTRSAPAGGAATGPPLSSARPGPGGARQRR